MKFDRRWYLVLAAFLYAGVIVEGIAAIADGHPYQGAFVLVMAAMVALIVWTWVKEKD